MFVTGSEGRWRDTTERVEKAERSEGHWELVQLTVHSVHAYQGVTPEWGAGNRTDREACAVRLGRKPLHLPLNFPVEQTPLPSCSFMRPDCPVYGGPGSASQRSSNFSLPSVVSKACSPTSALGPFKHAFWQERRGGNVSSQSNPISIPSLR